MTSHRPTPTASSSPSPDPARELLEMLPARFQQGYARMGDVLSAQGLTRDPGHAGVFFLALAADEIIPFPEVASCEDAAC